MQSACFWLVKCLLQRLLLSTFCSNMQDLTLYVIDPLMILKWVEKKNYLSELVSHFGRVNSWLCLSFKKKKKDHDLIFSHFERTIVCVLYVWNWMVSPFREQRRGNDLYSPAVSEWSWGGAEREREWERGGNYIVLPLCDNGLLWHSHTLWCGVSISQYPLTCGMNGKS